jgi:hypothetical protein
LSLGSPKSGCFLETADDWVERAQQSRSAVSPRASSLGTNGDQTQVAQLEESGAVVRRGAQRMTNLGYAAERAVGYAELVARNTLREGNYAFESTRIAGSGIVLYQLLFCFFDD